MMRFVGFSFGVILLGGCSDPMPNVSELPDTRCKNVIAYELSGKPNLTATHRYDGDDGELTEYVETNASGDQVFRLSRTYDAKGRRIGQVVDTTRLDPGHREMSWEYDEQDRVTRTTYDGWGADEKKRETRIYYDAMGRREHTETYENEVLSDRVNYVYIEGEPAIMEQRNIDVTDGSLEYGFRYIVADGKWLTRTEIFNVEIIQSVETYTYQDMNKGIVSRRDLDLPADGIIEYSDHYFWDANDRLERVEFDDGADGAVDQKYAYEYDAAGRVIKKHWFVYDQGHLEFVTVIDWSDKGLTYVERSDALNGGVIESWSFTYGCENPTMDVPIAPIQGFRYETTTFPHELDTTKWWRSFEML
ncbi:MAG: hypothetical protein IPM54_06935 [Polyangiaceae bacterium]|nr:hypothetical protein [Polyangiaceae bacterium]